MMNFKDKLADLLENANEEDIVSLYNDLGNGETIYAMGDISELNNLYDATDVLEMMCENPGRFDAYDDWWFCTGEVIESFNDIWEYIELDDLVNAIFCDEVDCDIPEVQDLMNDYHKVEGIHNKMSAIVDALRDLCIELDGYNGEFENEISDIITEKYPFTSDLDAFVDEVNEWVENFDESIIG